MEKKFKIVITKEGHLVFPDFFDDAIRLANRICKEKLDLDKVKRPNKRINGDGLCG